MLALADLSGRILETDRCGAAGRDCERKHIPVAVLLPCGRDFAVRRIDGCANVGQTFVVSGRNTIRSNAAQPSEQRIPAAASNIHCATEP